MKNTIPKKYTPLIKKVLTHQVIMGWATKQYYTKHYVDTVGVTHTIHGWYLIYPEDTLRSTVNDTSCNSNS